MGFATTMYCDKCGKIWIIFPPYADDSIICDICKNTLKPVPNEYFENLLNEGFLPNKDMEQKLVKDLILTSSNFDKYYFEHKDEIKSQQDRVLNAKIEQGRAVFNEQSNIPKCPTCSSTNIKRISTTAKVVNTALFGLLGTKRHKMFKCCNCGYEW